MKVLYCQDCGDIISPFSTNNQPRWCQCKRHAVWWVDGERGILRVHDIHRNDRQCSNINPEARAYVLGIHNRFLLWGAKHNAASVKAILDATEDTYIFKQWGTPLIRIRPGESGDTGWAKLPEAA